MRRQNFLKCCDDEFDLDDSHIVMDDGLPSIEAQNRLVHLVYVSKLCWHTKFDSKVFENIERISTINNHAHQLTGILCYGNGYFYQCVEGRYRDVIELKHKLCRDKRHRNINIYALEPIAKRRYQSWSMKPVVLEAWQLNKRQRRYLRPVQHYLPFKPIRWSVDDWKSFNKQITQFDTLSNNSATPRSLGSNITHSIINKVAPHQAFLFVQMILLILIILSSTAFTCL